MKTIINIIYPAFAAVVLTTGAVTANAATGDLIAADLSDNQGILQIPINPPFGTPSFVWNNANLPYHSFAGIAFDQAGNLYASDQATAQIYKLTPDRTTLNLFATGLNGPAGLAVDAAGNLYEADTGSGSINKFTPDGVRTTFAILPNGFGGASRQPTIIMAMDSHGNIYAASNQYEDPGNLPYVKIYKINPQGAVSTFVNLPSAFQSGVVACDSADNVLVLAVNSYSSPFTRRLFVYPPGAVPHDPPATPPPSYGGDDCSIGGMGLVIDSAGRVYIGDWPATVLLWSGCGVQSSAYLGNGYDPYETLGQLVIQPPAYAAQVQPPINGDGSSIFNARRGIVSVRFALTYGGASTCTLPAATIAVTRTGGGVTGEVNESVYTASADTGSNFRTSGCQYMYNLDSRALGVGIYRVDIKIYGGAVDSATFELR